MIGEVIVSAVIGGAVGGVVFSAIIIGYQLYLANRRYKAAQALLDNLQLTVLGQVQAASVEAATARKH